MATIQSHPPTLPEPIIPQSIQPGGGFCMELELAWGRLRRAWLHRFRPGYVRRMLAKRQGSCFECPHDVIDPRDLKYFRNTCGYWFAAEDDAFRRRDRLGLARAGLAEVVCFSLGYGALATVLALLGALVHWAFWLLLPVVGILWFETIFFFRDPQRIIPLDPAVLLSPADGTVTHIDEVEEPDLTSKWLRISIFLSVFDVHVNRVPRTSRVVRVRYFPGCFLDARHADCAVRNEQLWIDLEEEHPTRPVRVKQISGAIARRIVCWLKPGDRLHAGDRMGMIKFGSRTEVLLPAGEAVELQVKVGDKVKGGSSILLRFRTAPVAPPPGSA